MNFLFASPSSDDFIRLLKAWKFWLLGAVVGALIGAAIYYLALPPYRARASVNVDFHLERAWPQDTDREQFYYLERETRKLEEIAWSDAVLNQVASQVNGVTVDQMRSGKLQLSQPAVGGWHFFADDNDPKIADSAGIGVGAGFCQSSSYGSDCIVYKRIGTIYHCQCRSDTKHSDQTAV